MPDFTVVDGGGPEGRAWILAEEQLSDALQETAANILRIIRGAGSPYELVNQFNKVVQAAIKFREAFGHGPPSHMLAEMLRMHREMDERETPGPSWLADKKLAEDFIKAGALQIVASQFVGQTLQERAGEKEMIYGINQVIEAWRKAQESLQAKHPAKTGRKKQKPT